MLDPTSILNNGSSPYLHPITEHNFMVIGGEGELGSGLIRHIQKAGGHVHATYITKAQGNSAERSFLDLGGDVSSWVIPGRFTIAFLCAAVTSMESCRIQPDVSRKVNVENTLNIARRLSETGAALFFPSTSLVFDGKSPFRRANEPVNPQCEYGCQKIEAERGLAELTDRVSIIRFTKIIGRTMPLLQNWIAALRQGKTIHPFSNMVLAPVSLRYAVEVISTVMEKNSYGLWQVSAKEDITYEQLARYVAEKIDVSQKLIQPVKAEQSALKLKTIPMHTTLDTSRLQYELGIEPPSVWEALDEALWMQESPYNRK